MAAALHERKLARVHVPHALAAVGYFDAVMVHAALRIVVEKFRIGADVRDGLNELDLGFAEPALERARPRY